MSEPKIGRVLAASLHQSINELMPARVEFYESWLTAVRIRKGELGRARVAAVISFLRQEGAEYDAIVDRAGRYAADWMVDALPVESGGVDRAATDATTPASSSDTPRVSCMLAWKSTWPSKPAAMRPRARKT